MEIASGLEIGKKRDGRRELSWKAAGQYLIEAEVAAEVELMEHHCVKAAVGAAEEEMWSETGVPA